MEMFKKQNSPHTVNKHVLQVTNGPSNSWRANTEVKNKVQVAAQRKIKEQGMWQTDLNAHQSPTFKFWQITSTGLKKFCFSLIFCCFYDSAFPLHWCFSNLHSAPADSAGSPGALQLSTANTDTNPVLEEESPHASDTAPTRNLKSPPGAQLQPCICTENRLEVKKWFSK